MPIQEEEKASGKPAAKARPISKPSSTSGWDLTPNEQRQFIDIETQESKNPHCFHVSKFITRLLRHSQQVDERRCRSPLRQVIDECKKKQSDNTGYWSDEMKKDFVNAPHWSIEKWVSVLAKGGGQKKRFQYCLNPNCPHQFLYLRTIQKHSGSAINPMRLATCKNRAIQKYLVTLPEYSMLVQFEARSTKRTAILSFKIKRSYSLRHTACRVH